ncbi:MAG: acyltransferase family protein [Hyphomicrobiales bacterium]|nr:acyltransferase family protein [Hyphomicrobiales bacterium]
MSGSAPESRLDHLDHLRASLVILVVVHHLALVYGASAPFYYVEPPFDEPGTFVLLTDFVLFNQAWFMGLLFLLAGHFTPGSVDRLGPGAFARARLVRLGLPVLVFILVLNPLASVGYFLMPASLTGIKETPDWTAYFGLWGLGPLWFAALLLIFDLGYAVWRATAARRPAPPAPVPADPAPGRLALAAVGGGRRGPGRGQLPVAHGGAHGQGSDPGGGLA